MKHKELYEVLKPVFRFAVSEAVLQRLETHFHKLVHDQMSWPNSGRIRLPKLGVLREGTGWGWFPVNPGVNRKVRQATVPFIPHPCLILPPMSKETRIDLICLQGYLYRLRKSVLQVWKFGAKGGLEEQRTIEEKDVVTVPKGDRDFVATPWKIARSSEGGTDISYRNTLPIPNQHQRTVETTISREAYKSYKASNSERLEYNENDGGLDTNLEYGIYDDNDMADPDQDPTDSLYYQWDVAEVDSDVYDGNYDGLDGTYTDDDHYEGNYTDLDTAYTDDDYCDDDYSGLDMAYAEDDYYDGFYDDVDVAGPDDDLDGLDPDADSDYDLGDADSDYDLGGTDPDEYPDIADPDVADPDDDDDVEY